MTLDERSELERLLEARDEHAEGVRDAEDTLNFAKGRHNDAHHAVLQRVEQFISEAYNTGMDQGKKDALTILPWGGIVPAGTAPDGVTIIETHDERAIEFPSLVERLTESEYVRMWAHDKNDKIVPYAGCSCETCDGSRLVSEALRRQGAPQPPSVIDVLGTA